ncbi:GlxA family transcriptional regulator [Halotalea alkalilenta]|uniref:Transcriptional regulator n=1 Tax=Halotalea alkalilenta TaxID=376489 RepID=A0A172YBJ5_9GAMM|nr:DJ-1/PfpI family protein [Halotalea alkalilenta]ANF56620.1 transcriptional regulator [Halotalea alkalilenta]
MTSPPPIRTVASLLYPGVMSLDVCGPLQAFASANVELARRAAEPAYAIRLLGTEAGAIESSAGIRLVADRPYTDCSPASLDTLLVPGGEGVEALLGDTALIDWLRRAEPLVRRLGSVCSGALLLAATGLLDGRLATTHWADASRLASGHPLVSVDGDRLHTFDASARDGDPHLFTSAGVTAGIDLALALIEADLGRSLALAVARRLVMFVRRPGGQAQFSALLVPDARSEKLGALLEWIAMHLDQDLCLERLAERACTTPRSLSRMFVGELGMPPGRYVERLRVDTARSLLDDGQVGIDTVARLTGIKHAENLRRLFHKHLAVSPSAYRARFTAGENR